MLLRLPGHRHETDRQDGAGRDLATALLDQAQLLNSGRADGDHYAATFLELVDQPWRDVLGRTGHDDRIERRVLGPTLVPVTRLHVHVVETEPLQVRTGAPGEGFDDFHAVNFRHEPRED